jgi:hypothetical protein
MASTSEILYQTSYNNFILTAKRLFKSMIPILYPVIIPSNKYLLRNSSNPPVESGLPIWTPNGGYDFPMLGHNNQGSSVQTFGVGYVPPGKVFTHPGLSNTYSGIGWQSPISDNVDIVVSINTYQQPAMGANGIFYVLHKQSNNTTSKVIESGPLGTQSNHTIITNEDVLEGDLISLRIHINGHSIRDGTMINISIAQDTKEWNLEEEFSSVPNSNPTIIDGKNIWHYYYGNNSDINNNI